MEECSFQAGVFRTDSNGRAMEDFLGNVESEADQEEQRVFGVRRKAYLATVLLIGLVNFGVFIASRTVPMPLRLRLFNYTLCIYSVALLGYVSYGFWKSWRHNRSLAELSSRDPLTGLLNWRGLSLALTEMRTAASHSGDLPRLLYVDVAGLDQVNAEYGQPVGDAALRGIAKVLATDSPEGSAVGRVGGDEFLIIMTSSEREDAQRAGELIAERIDQYSLDLGPKGKIDTLTAQVRVIASVSEDETLTEAVASAREALAFRGSGEEAGVTQALCYPVPRVTLGACVCFRWDWLDVATRNEFSAWREVAGEEFLNRMIGDLMALVALKADARPFDFVTAPPAVVGGADKMRGPQRLAERMAHAMGIPYRQVLVASPAATALGYIEPRVGVQIEKGSYILLVCDLIRRGTTLKHCVHRLTEAGAFVQVLGWVAQPAGAGTA